MSAHGIRRLCLAPPLAGGAPHAYLGGDHRPPRPGRRPRPHRLAPRCRRPRAHSRRRCTASSCTPTPTRAPAGCRPAQAEDPDPARRGHARLAHPKLAIEGDTVEIVLPHARARRRSGPTSPTRTRRVRTPPTLDATFASVRGTVPLAAWNTARSATSSARSTVRRSRSATAGGSPCGCPAGSRSPWSCAPRCRSATGAVRYRPAGRHAVASWDFDKRDRLTLTLWWRPPSHARARSPGCA